MAVSPQTSKDMNKDLQNKAWQCLPAEFRKGLRETYARTENNPLFEQTAITLCDFFGHENLKSDTEPSELLFVERKKVISLYAEGERKMRGVVYLSILKEFFGDKCLPDKQPIFSETQQNENNDNVIVGSEKLSEVKPNLSENLSETKDNMEEKELNLCELLKGCEGEKFFSLMFGDVTFVKVIEEPNLGFGEKPIATSEGRYLPNAMYGLDGVPTLFPSRALYEKYPLDPYSAWMEWKEARKPVYGLFGSMLIFEDGAKVDEIDFPDINFSSLEEAQQAAEGVREYLQKFHEKNIENRL